MPDDKDAEKRKKELEAVKAAAARAWKIHQGKRDKGKSNGKPKPK